VKPGAVLRRIFIANADSPVPESLIRDSCILLSGLFRIMEDESGFFLSPVKNTDSDARAAELLLETFQKTYSVTRALFGS
jgi:hypothetical protein